MLTVATCLWDPNPDSFPWSRCYDESWVEKLYRGFARNLTVPFEFVCFTDRHREFKEDIRLEDLDNPPGYASYIEPFRTGEPMILAGLDTIVLRNVDHLAEYCMRGPTWATDVKIALPRDPYCWSRACNGVALIPADNMLIHLEHNGENDMEWLRSRPHVFIDDCFPGSVKSYKGHVLGETDGVAKGIDGVDIVYFHGEPKMHQMTHVGWIKEHWN